MATFKPVVLVGKKHLKQDGTSNIKIRIYHNLESQYISMKHYINPVLLDNSGNISSLADNSELLNYEINNTVQKLRAAYIRMGNARTMYMTCSDLKKEIERSLVQQSEIIDFVTFSRQIIKGTKKEKTAQWYEGALQALCSFTRREKIDVKAITSDLLNKMIFSLNEKGLEPGTVSNYLRGIRALYNKAKLAYNNEDYDIIRIPGDPFKRVNIPVYRRKRKSISVELIMRIRDYESDKARTNMARDVFMMMFYLMGINISDLYGLSCERRGRIEYKRMKTTTDKNYEQILLSINIEPELRVLIDKYSEGYFLSYFHTNYNCFNNFLRAVNLGLKDICKVLNLDFKVTSNWARHSWASLARNKAFVPKADIDFCLGHVNNDYKMADIYIDIDYGVCDRANRVVLNLLQKK
mgnify:FL=1